jgi:ammonia channel protein AmtB
MRNRIDKTCRYTDPFFEMTIGLRVSEDAEREGLDLASHGERAFNM